jgi:cytosine permease
MANGTLPGYLASAKPNPAANRAPWYKNTAPTYAGIFLGVPFMAGLTGCLAFGSLWAGIVGLILGSLFSFLLYYIPGILGLKTGFPLYVVGSSTFGTHGGILMPGLLMGLLQIGWHAVMTFAAVSFLMQAIKVDAGPNTPIFWGACLAWGLSLALVGAIGVKWLAWLSSWIPILPLVVIVIAGLSNLDGLEKFPAAMAKVTAGTPAIIPLLGLGAFAAIQAVAGFAATAMAAGTDFGTNSRNEKDVVLGGFFGIAVAAFIAGLFALLAMAGAMGNDPTIAAKVTEPGFGAFISSIAAVGGWVSQIMFWVFVAASICGTGFCALIAANSFSTMFPKLPRVPMTLFAGLIGSCLAATGVAANLVGFFGLIGASFGPIIGAMMAEYIRYGKWMGPRKGINWAGYLAWALGFFIGIFGAIPSIGFAYGQETLISFIVGFTAYLIFADLGLEPKVVDLPCAKA